ncbi:MAG: patatin-like phospholipase family protein [Polyangia bacterium]
MSLAVRLRGRRVGLALASGFFGFYHHAGVLLALDELGVRPARVAGNSAGALVGSLYAAGLAPAEIRDLLLSVRRGDFWDPGWPLGKTGFGLLAGHRFAATLAEALPVHSFDRCRAPFAAGVYDLDDGRVRHLDDGPLIPAVLASCAVPYLFSPVEIDGRRYWDGGFGEKTPLVPFLTSRDVDAVVVSYLPPRTGGKSEKSGWRRFVPSLSSLAASIPELERVERDRESARLLRENGIDVLVLAPERVELGPFSLGRAPEAMRRGRLGARAILDSNDESLLGHELLRSNQPPAER